jgi:uncharacterized damage-inducible protein DinB
MTPDHCQALARYNRWMNEKLCAAAAQLTDDARKQDRGAFFRSIHATLNHILLADRVWMGRFTGAALEGGAMGPGGIRSLDQELYEGFEELRAERRTTDDEITQWVATLDAERLSGELRFLRKGIVNAFPLWWGAAQLFNHQTHHRGQVTTLLMQAGLDPGVTDLIAMLRSEAATGSTERSAR